MQDLLVNAVAATIQRFRLKVVNFLICIDVGGRLPGKFCEVWPQMQSCLGGKKLGSFCHFVITKANADSKVAKAADSLEAADVRADVEGLEVKRKIANDLRNWLFELELKMKERKLKAAQILVEMKNLQAEIKNVNNQVSGQITEYLRKVIQEFECRETDFERKWKAATAELHKCILNKMEEIREMEKLGNPFRHLVEAPGKFVKEAVKSKL
eukprot:s2312_g3.t1